MTTIAVIGLGYVGLPLAVEFGKKFRTIGFDLSAEKVAAYREFNDPTGEVSAEDLRAATQLTCHTDPPCCARPTSWSSPCPRRSTRPISPTSRRW
jgi:UDP-N-acetyl-D-mannosaminuronate dehydrogenase